MTPINLSLANPEPHGAARGRPFTAAQGDAGHGATAVVVMNVSGADPLGTIRLYGEHVLPQLRG
jgi:hypothetical protein